MKLKSYYLPVILFLASSMLTAQDASLYEEFKKSFKKKYFNVGVLFQTLFEYQPERMDGKFNGFEFTNIRLTLGGEFDEGFGYRMQTNFINTRPILDAFMFYKPTPSVRIDIGQYKSPFSTEYLISESAVDFVNRSQVVDVLSPKRHIGIQTRADFMDKSFSVIGGIFNGTGTFQRNNNKHFMYFGKLIAQPKLPKDFSLIVSANAAFNKEPQIITSTDTTNAIDRTYFGGDFRFTYKEFMLSSEYIHQTADVLNAVELKHSGYHITSGYMITSEIQALARYDYLKMHGGNESKLIVIGFNYWPTEVVKFQANYIVDTDNSEIKYNRFLFNAQLAF